MNIALLGWYGHGNAGDERIEFCMNKFLTERGHRCYVHDFSKFLKQPEKEINRYDYILMGGGGLIHNGQNKLVKKLDKIRSRFSCIGIGIEGFSASNKKFIGALLEKSEFFMVRDRASYRLTGPHYKAVCSHDLSFLYPYPAVEMCDPGEQSCGLNLLDWPFWNVEYNTRLDKYLRRWKFQKFVSLYPFGKHDPQKIILLTKENFNNIQGIPFYTNNKPHRYMSDGRLLVKHGVHLAQGECFDIELMKRLPFHIGMRFHHMVFCIQLGIPCIGLAYQRKNYSIVKETGVPKIGVDIYDIEKLPGAIRYMKDNRDEIRRKFLKYRSRAHGELWETMGKITRLMDSPAR